MRHATPRGFGSEISALAWPAENLARTGDAGETGAESLTKENCTGSNRAKRESRTPTTTVSTRLSTTIGAEGLTAKGAGCCGCSACIPSFACSAAGLPSGFFTESFAEANGGSAVDGHGATPMRTSSRPHSDWRRHSARQERQEREAKQDAKDDQEWQVN